MGCHKYGYPKIDGLQGNATKTDDEQGYPHFRKPIVVASMTASWGSQPQSSFPVDQVHMLAHRINATSRPSKKTNHLRGISQVVPCVANFARWSCENLRSLTCSRTRI